MSSRIIGRQEDTPDILRISRVVSDVSGSVTCLTAEVGPSAIIAGDHHIARGGIGRNSIPGLIDQGGGTAYGSVPLPHIVGIADPRVLD